MTFHDSLNSTEQSPKSLAIFKASAKIEEEKKTQAATNINSLSFSLALSRKAPLHYQNSSNLHQVHDNDYFFFQFSSKIKRENIEYGNTLGIMFVRIKFDWFPRFVLTNTSKSSEKFPNWTHRQRVCDFELAWLFEISMIKCM